MKIEYHINDKQGLISYFEKQNIGQEFIDFLKKDLKEFDAIYTLEGEKHSGTLNYTLVDGITKEKLKINSLNAYEKSLLNKCQDHFHSDNPPEFIVGIEIIQE